MSESIETPTLRSRLETEPYRVARQLVASLYGDVCPACGGPKRQRQTMCFACYKALPPALKTRLYDRVGNGYELAVVESLEFLDVATAHLPEPPASRGGA